MHRTVGLAQADTLTALGRGPVGRPRDHHHRIAVEVADRVVGEVGVDVGLAAEFLEEGDVGVESGATVGQREVFRTDAHDHGLQTGTTQRGLRFGVDVHGGARHGDHAVDDRRHEEVHPRRADEPGDECVDRAVVQFRRRGELLEHTVLQDSDTIPHRHRLDLVVGDIDGRGAQTPLQGRDLGTGLNAEFGVEVRQRFVHAEDLRFANDGPPHGDTLPLATRQLRRLAVEEVGQVEQPRGLGDLALALVGGHAAHLQRETHVLPDGLVGVQRVVLEDHRDVAVLGCDADHVVATDPDLTGVDLFESGEHAQGGGLARARRSDEDHELTVVDVQVQ